MPTRPTKHTDTRAKKFIGTSVELDAIPAGKLRALVRECIERHVDQRQFGILKVAEASERDFLKMGCDVWRERSMSEPAITLNFELPGSGCSLIIDYRWDPRHRWSNKSPRSPPRPLVLDRPMDRLDLLAPHPPGAGMMDLRAAARALGGDVQGKSIAALALATAIRIGRCRCDWRRTASSSSRSPATTGRIVATMYATTWDCLSSAARNGAGRGLRRRQENQSLSSQPGPDPKIASARKLWEAGVEPRGTAAEAYLKTRALVLPNAALRFNLRTPWHDEETGITWNTPCLIAAFRSIHTDEITGIHRMRLDQPERWPKMNAACSAASAAPQ